MMSRKQKGTKYLSTWRRGIGLLVFLGFFSCCSSKFISLSVLPKRQQTLLCQQVWMQAEGQLGAQTPWTGGNEPRHHWATPTHPPTPRHPIMTQHMEYKWKRKWFKKKNPSTRYHIGGLLPWSSALRKVQEKHKTCTQSCHSEPTIWRSILVTTAPTSLGILTRRSQLDLAEGPCVENIPAWTKTWIGETLLGDEQDFPTINRDR